LPEDLLVSLSSSGLQQDYATILAKTFGESRQEIQSLLQNVSFDTTRLKEFDWRFEVEVRHQQFPNFLPKFIGDFVD
jgi:hypothetical protein